MSEREKKRQRIYDLLNAKTKPGKVSELIGVNLWSPSSPDLKPTLIMLYRWRFRKQNKSTSHPNIESLKTAIEEEWYKMSEEFILKA